MTQAGCALCVRWVEPMTAAFSVSLEELNDKSHVFYLDLVLLAALSVSLKTHSLT